MRLDHKKPVGVFCYLSVCGITFRHAVEIKFALELAD